MNNGKITSEISVNMEKIIVSPKVVPLVTPDLPLYWRPLDIFLAFYSRNENSQKHQATFYNFEQYFNNPEIQKSCSENIFSI